jgi:hypothetical protein
VSESKLEQAFRHVTAGRQVVARQRALIEKRKTLGADVSESESLLEQFERTLAIFESDLAELRKNSK